MDRAVQRGIGTVFGSLVAVVITMTLTSPLLLTAALVPLSVAAVVTRPRSYRLFTFFLTPIFVLLASRWQGDWSTAAARAGDAIAGGAIAIIAALVFPSREHKRLAAALRSVLDTLGRYADTVVDARLRGQIGSHDVVRARRELGVALGAAEASLERLLSEPLRSVRRTEDAVLLVTYARRLAAAFTALDARHDQRLEEATAAPALAYVHAALKRARPGAKTAPPTTPPTPPVLPPHAPAAADLARILRQAELVSSLSRRARAVMAPTSAAS